MSEAAESSWKRRAAFGLGAVKYAEKSGKNGRERKREFHQGPGAQGSGKKLLNRTGNTDKLEL